MPPSVTVPSRGVSSLDTYRQPVPAFAEGAELVGGQDERAEALRDVWRALWSSRLLVWASGIATVLALGQGPVRHVFNPLGVTRGFGWLGNILTAPVARWDSAWYLVIAHFGYRPDLGDFTASRTAFFPLYPLSIGGLERLGMQPIVAGVLISTVALTAALYALHRLTTLEIGGEAATLAVFLTALAPMAFYFSAVYSESLYLALSVWVFLCARRGQWGLAGALGALGSATRNTGILLMVPVALLYLYGPRGDRSPDRGVDRRPGWVPGSRGFAARLSALAPRYRVRRDVLWLALIPMGLGLYMGHLALAGGDPFAPFHAQTVWGRQFVGPFLGVWDGAKAAFQGVRQLLSMQRTHLYFPAGGASPFINAGHNLMLFGFLLAAVPAIVGAVRLLPFAYGAYVLCALSLPLSYPVATQPLMSLPRFLLVLFPLNMWLAARLSGRPRALAAVLGISSVAMMFFTAEFSTWHWVS